MKYKTMQIADRFGNKPKCENESVIDFGKEVEIGYTCYVNNITDDDKSGMYVVIGVADNDLAC